MAAIRSAFGPSPKIVFAAHSVGSWLVLQALKNLPSSEISGTFLLFPTICNIGNTPNGRRLSVRATQSIAVHRSDHSVVAIRTTPSSSDIFTICSHTLASASSTLCPLPILAVSPGLCPSDSVTLPTSHLLGSHYGRRRDEDHTRP